MGRYGVAAVLPTFVSQKSGHVIATSSVAGLKAYPGGAIPLVQPPSLGEDGAGG